jgi:hypothetical protein
MCEVGELSNPSREFQRGKMPQFCVGDSTTIGARWHQSAS